MVNLDFCPFNSIIYYLDEISSSSTTFYNTPSLPPAIDNDIKHIWRYGYPYIDNNECFTAVLFLKKFRYNKYSFNHCKVQSSTKKLSPEFMHAITDRDVSGRADRSSYFVKVCATDGPILWRFIDKINKSLSSRWSSEASFVFFVYAIL